jgi:signal transduction histidine kinase
MLLFHLLTNAYESFLLGPCDTVDPMIQLDVTQSADGGLEIRVRDNGPGIHPETLELLRQFVPGHTTKKNKGTGFGLPTAQRYAEAHGGALWIDSMEGEGAEITVAIPMETEDEL